MDRPFVKSREGGCSEARKPRIPTRGQSWASYSESSARMRPAVRSTALAAAVLLGFGCEQARQDPDTHGPIAGGISARLGEPWPGATDEQRATFERGREVALRRFTLAEGLGPAFNVSFCGGCHEKPTLGGSSGLYRNFFIAGRRTSDGAFLPISSAGSTGGIQRIYSFAPGVFARPPADPSINVVAQRNAIPFYGAGFLAELSDDEIEKRADPDDRDGDGISGRVNQDRGLVGRFGRKAQTARVEGFIRAPLFNQLGITTDPLTEEQRARLPVDSSSHAAARGSILGDSLSEVPDGPTTDDDGVSDPELSPQQVFDLVSFTMLMAAPQVEPETPRTARGRRLFDQAACGACHTPRLESPRGALPVYSDLLLHDMGPDLADGIGQGLATGSEFRTQPLWGVGADGPFLHDGRAGTLREAILLHGGEAKASRERAAALANEEMEDLIEFLRSLGGRDQASAGLLASDAPVPEVGAFGGPRRDLSAEERARFLRGRAEFDRDRPLSAGIGAPRLNGDSCRACHFDPVIGGAGPRDVNVMRHGLISPNGEFIPPAIGTVLHKTTGLQESLNAAQLEARIFEHRQTPALFGAGLIDAIAPETIASRADPLDEDHDGIRGRVSHVDGGRVGRFGWKAQVPSLAEFARDALSTELGLTVPFVPGLTFGLLQDDDRVPDPETDAGAIDDLAFFMSELAPPPWRSTDPVAEAEGEKHFSDLGCSACHVPELPSDRGPVRLYSDLLIHAILAPGALGVEESSAGMRDFRTAPLWGLSSTAPYWHSGEADTIEQAVRLHEGEGLASRLRYEALGDAEKRELLAFLRSL
jgi:CxxC motif-containing protein (DUF1111 family)